MQKFVIALNLEARRSRSQIDLAEILEAQFHDVVRVVERGYGGKSVTVEMPLRLAPTVREQLPFVTVEPELEIDLL